MKSSKVVHLKPANSGKIQPKECRFFYTPMVIMRLSKSTWKLDPTKSRPWSVYPGAGKSTLISLLDKFYQPDTGKIELDGIDLQDIDTAYLRDHIGLVLQKNHIFQGSILDNIRYGKINATDDEVYAAAEKASIHEQIFAAARSLPIRCPDAFRWATTAHCAGTHVPQKSTDYFLDERNRQPRCHC